MFTLLWCSHILKLLLHKRETMCLLASIWPSVCQGALSCLTIWPMTLIYRTHERVNSNSRHWGQNLLETQHPNFTPTLDKMYSLIAAYQDVIPWLPLSLDILYCWDNIFWESSSTKEMSVLLFEITLIGKKKYQANCKLNFFIPNYNAHRYQDSQMQNVRQVVLFGGGLI